MDTYELYALAIEKLEEVRKVRGGEESNPSVIARQREPRGLRWVARHQCWKSSVKTHKRWGNPVDKRRVYG